jgi:hypothetical protein
MMLYEKGVKINTHSIIGVIMTFATFFLAISGWVSFLLRETRKNTTMIIVTGQAHSYAGLLLFYLGFICNASGLYVYFTFFDRDQLFWAPVSLGVMIILAIGFEIRY